MLKSFPASSKTALKLSALLMLWGLQKIWGQFVLGYTFFLPIFGGWGPVGAFCLRKELGGGAVFFFLLSHDNARVYMPVTYKSFIFGKRFCHREI